MKYRRHFAIRDILSSERISTQEELCEALHNRGYKITQATVSRDIKELSLVKITDEEGYRYAWPDAHIAKNLSSRTRRAFRDSVISIDSSENIIVIKTLPGAAQAIASHIDGLDKPPILGTVAGDDTIMVVIKTRQRLGQVLEYFQKLVSE